MASNKKASAHQSGRKPTGATAGAIPSLVRPRAVILTALRSEYSAVLAHLSDVREQTHEQGTVYEEGVFYGDQSWDIALVEIGAGNVKTAAEAERAMQHFRPRVLLFVGVAGGLKDVRIGDVVVATKVYGYESGKSESEFLPRPHVFGASYRLEQRARAEARKDDWLRRLTPAGGEPRPKVHIGAIAAGEKVVASRASDISRLIQDNYGDSLAIEMEGHGLLEAASINERVDALVIRGISDLLDKKTESDAASTQETAAAHAAAFAFQLLASIEPATMPPLTPPLSVPPSGNLPEYPPSQAIAEVRVVDIAGRGHHRTIVEAIEAAAPGEQISIKPGMYTDPIIINKVLELIGDSKEGDDIVVQCSKVPCLSFRTTMGRVSNITFRLIGATEEACIDIGQGRLEMEACNVSSQRAAGIAIHDGADPRIRYSNVHDNKKAGIVIFADGSGTIEENTLFHNGEAGLEITTGGGPTVRNNVISDNGGVGVLVHNQGTGVLDSNHIFGNEMGVFVSVGSKMTIRRNKIHDNTLTGVRIGGQAEGVVESNTITGHQRGIQILHESRCTIRNNRVQGASRSGIEVREKSHVEIERNQISGHSYWGVQVESASTANIRKNRIHSCSASAIRVSGKSSANIEGNRLFRNNQCGVNAEELGDIVIRGNTIVKNGSFGVHADKIELLTLENNDLRENFAPKKLDNVEKSFDSGNQG